MHHALLVAGLEVPQALGVVGGLEQRLADAGDVAVAEDAEAASEQRLLDPVALAALLGEEPHHCLPDSEPHRRAVRHEPFLPPAEVSGSRGSTGWSAQVPRTHACTGSSQIAQIRSSPGPAITLR